MVSNYAASFHDFMKTQVSTLGRSNRIAVDTGNTHSCKPPQRQLGSKLLAQQQLSLLRGLAERPLDKTVLLLQMSPIQ